jgi:hypothetical protein
MPLYTRTEYDAFTVGEFRQVQSYCPRRHTYVTDYAAPIVAPTVDTPHTGDEQLGYEPLDRTGYDTRTIKMHQSVDRKRKAREQRLIEYLRTRPGKCAPIMDVAPLLNCGTETLQRMCTLSQDVHYERRGQRAYVFLREG